MRSKRTLYNIIAGIILQVITIIYGFVVPKIIISCYGSNVNGLVSSISQFLAYIALLDSGFTVVVKSGLYKPIANNNKDDIEKILKSASVFFRKIAIIFIFYLIVLSFVYPLLVIKDFEYFYTISLIIIISISTFAEYYLGMIYKIYLNACQRGYVISVIQIITYILIIFITIILAKVGVSIHILKLFTTIIFIFRPILQNMYVKKNMNINIKNVKEKYELKNKWDGLAQHIASVIHTNTDVAILTFFSRLSEVSVYSVYALVVSGVKSIVKSFSNGIEASFGDMIARDEKDKFRENFNIYEILYFSLITIMFTCTMVLIVPFISVYTKNISDTNYIRPVFGMILVLSEYVWAVRLPYSSITLSAGHFKETRIGAWVECFTNLILSIILIKKFGIIGIAIGTLVSMIIRTLEFIFHSNKYILNRSLFESIYKISLIIFETLLIIITVRFIPKITINSYASWVYYSIIIFVISTIIVLICNVLIYKKYLLLIKKKVLNLFKKGGRKNNGII